MKAGRRYRWGWLLVLALPLVGIGFVRLKFDVEMLNLLPRDLPVVQGLQLYQRHFSDARELVLTLSGPDAETVSLTARRLAERLRREQELVDTATWQAPWKEHPEQSAELIAYLWLNQPPAVFGQLTNRLADSNLADRLNLTKEKLATSFSPEEIGRLSYDPYNLMRLPGESGWGDLTRGDSGFASSDGRFRWLSVHAASSLSSYPECMEWLNRIGEVLESAKADGVIPPEIDVRQTGRPAFVAEIAGGMERDMKASVSGALVVIAVLFWLVHRRWQPLLWLIVLLVAIAAGMLAIGGLLFGTLNVISTGFAAILVGLSVDYALVLYQEWRGDPGRTPGELNRRVGGTILWAAATTAAAFAVLNLCGLPGLAQLGSLVAIGVLVGATVMLYGFLPPLSRWIPAAKESKTRKTSSFDVFQRMAALYDRMLRHRLSALILWGGTVLAAAVALAMVWNRPPHLDASSDPLRPRQSEAYAAMESMRRHLDQPADPWWLLARGNEASEVAEQLDRAETILGRPPGSNALQQVRLPTALWPRTGNQQSNRPAAAWLAARADTLIAAARRHGFKDEAMRSTATMLQTWERAEEQPLPIWPTNRVSRWILDRFTARQAGEYAALGLLYPESGSSREEEMPNAAWIESLRFEGMLVAGWDLLAPSVLEVIRRDLNRVLWPMACVLVIALWIVFGRFKEVSLSFATLGFSGLFLWAVMAWAGWDWNLFNLMALPLLLGVGIDYSIHMQRALQRNDGDLLKVLPTMGRALLLCGATTATGFGSLSWSSNAGLASLGQVCAAGVVVTAVVAVFLLPVWWKRGMNLDRQENATLEVKTQPSQLYGAGWWRLGLSAACWIPRPLLRQMSRLLAILYWRANAARREAVIRNLLPPLENDRAKAARCGRRLLAEFGYKLADLWRYEAGLPIEPLFSRLTGWEHYQAAQQQRRGILLLTVHLGNWEFGGPLLSREGVRLQVVTQAEPDARLTEIRQSSRARWGIETLVLGPDNAFGFVEIIRRLEAGATIALLMDRPAAKTAVTVELFGRPFQASLAAAELARATGCSLLPVYLPREGNGYSGHMLEEIRYDRTALRDREARRQLTQRIMLTFEAPIRRHLTQWYHFIPIWP